MWAALKRVTIYYSNQFFKTSLLFFSFALAPLLLIPFLHPRDDECNYNNSHKGMRVVEEQSFWVTNWRFRCLHKSGGVLICSLGKCCKITMAYLILHNICIDGNVSLDKGMMVKMLTMVAMEVCKWMTFLIVMKIMIMRIHFIRMDGKLGEIPLCKDLPDN